MSFVAPEAQETRMASWNNKAQGPLDPGAMTASAECQKALVWKTIEATYQMHGTKRHAITNDQLGPVH